MKIFAALTIMLGFSLSGTSQVVTDNEQISATANVIGVISVTNESNLEFGNVSVAGPKIISRKGEASGLGNITGTTTTQGIFKVAKGTNTSVDIKLTAAELNLTHSDGTTKLPVTYDPAWTLDETDGTVGATTFNYNTDETVAITDAEFYVHVGGQVTPTSTAQKQGIYTANVTLTATYN